MSDFDPLYVWLGIPPEEQPPDHYRLLGIKRFEIDLEVIAHAADRQMAHVKTFQSGKHGADSQKILNLLSAARKCLLNADQKRTYDDSLQQSMVVAPPATPPMAIPLPPSAMPFGQPGPFPGQYPMAIPASYPPMPVAAADPMFAPPAMARPPAGPMIQSPTVTLTPHRKPASGIPPMALWGGIAAAGVMLGLIGVLLWNASSPEVAVQPSPDPKVIENPAIATPVSPKPVKERDPNAKPKPSDADPKKQPAKTDSPVEVPVVAGPTISVLSQIGDHPLIAGGISPGEWKKDGGKLRGVNSGVLFPVEPPDDYLLDIAIDRIDANAHLIVGFPVADSTACVVLNWHFEGQHISGFHQIDGVDSNRWPDSYRQQVFFDNKTARVRITVRGNAVKLLVDETKVIDWRGDPARLSANPHWVAPGERSFYLGLGGGAAEFSSITMTPYKPSPKSPRPEARFALNAPKLLAPPTADELKELVKTAQGEFAGEIAAAKTSPALQLLAKNIRAAALKEETPRRRFAFNALASQLALKGLDASLSCEIVDDMSKTFDVDALELNVQGIEQAFGQVDDKTPIADLRRLAAAVSLQLDRAIAADRYDVAGRVGKVCTQLARHDKFGELRDFAAKRAADLDWASTLHQEYRKGDDTSAGKLAQGRYECFVRGDWPKGLKRLAEGSDGPLAMVARLELNPGLASTRDIGDAWWQLSKTAAAPWDAEYKRQARYWYEKTPRLLSVDELKQRIDGVDHVPDNRFAPGLVGAYYTGDQFGLFRMARIDQRIATYWRTGNPDASIAADNFTAVWTGTIRAPVPGKYYLAVNSDDGSRVDLDGKILWDQFGAGAGERGVQVDLTGEPQRLVIYFHDLIVYANCTLRWRRADEQVDQIVDAHYLKHDPAFAKQMHATDVLGDYPDTTRVRSAPEGGLLCLFEDQKEIRKALTEDAGQLFLEKNDRYSGEASLRLIGVQRWGIDSFQIRVSIREKPGPGEYRYLRFAWKKFGGQRFGLQLHGTSPQLEDWRRYHLGPEEKTFGSWPGLSIRLAEEIPKEWTVVTRDLFADFGEFDIRGMALTNFDGQAGLFDHIYLARDKEDFARLGSER